MPQLVLKRKQNSKLGWKSGGMIGKEMEREKLNKMNFVYYEI